MRAQQDGQERRREVIGDDYPDFCGIVRSVRAAAGLSVDDAAKEIGITPRVLQSIEAGKNCPGEAFIAAHQWVAGMRAARVLKGLARV